MLTVFRYHFTRLRGQMLGWGIGMGLLGMLVASFFDTIKEQGDQFQQLFESYPPAMSAFFGDLTKLTTPAGYLTAEFFSIAPIMLGIFAVLVGSGLVVADEESGTLDLVLAHPVSRTTLFVGRLLALVAVSVGILAIAWAGLMLSMQWSSLGVDWWHMALPFISLLAILMVVAMLALLLSLVLPSRRVAAATAYFLLVASYFVTSLATLNDSLKTLARISPLNYYQSGNAINGLNISWVLVLLAVATLLAIVAWWRFERRDIRVGGEHGWRLRLLRRRTA
jgi:ABC-2 type transport system permease protein